MSAARGVFLVRPLTRAHLMGAPSYTHTHAPRCLDAANAPRTRRASAHMVGVDTRGVDTVKGSHQIRTWGIRMPQLICRSKTSPPPPSRRPHRSQVGSHFDAQPTSSKIFSRRKRRFAAVLAANSPPETTSGHRMTARMAACPPSVRARPRSAQMSARRRSGTHPRHARGVRYRSSGRKFTRP